MVGAQVEHWPPPDVSQAVRLLLSLMRMALAGFEWVRKSDRRPSKDKAEQTASHLEKGCNGLPVGS